MSEMTPDSAANTTTDETESPGSAPGKAAQGAQEASDPPGRSARPADASASTPPAAPAGPADASGDEWDEEDSILTWKLLVAVAVVLGVVFVGAFVFFNNNKKKDSTASTEGTGSTTTAAAAAQLPAIRDSFDRPDNKELGKASTGEDWQAITGIWGIRGKQAAVVEENPTGPRNLAILDTGSGDGSVSAKAAKLVDGWGLVFRYRGPNAYWFIQWNDQYKSFHVFKVQDGNAKEVVKGGVGVPNSKDGMNVKVEYSGPSITLLAEGKPLETFQDPYLKDQTKVGLFAVEKSAATARWSDFTAQKGLAGPPVTAAPDPKDKASTPSSQPKPKPSQAGQGGQAGQAPKPGGGATTTTK